MHHSLHCAINKYIVCRNQKYIPTPSDPCEAAYVQLLNDFKDKYVNYVIKTVTLYILHLTTVNKLQMKIISNYIS